MAKTKLASRAAAWLRDGRILVIPEIIITDQASPPSLGRRAEWISRAQPRPSVPFSPNSGREDCAGLSSRTPARTPLCLKKHKNPSRRTWPNWPATNRRRPHPKGCPATTVVPPAVLLSSEADLWSCRTSYSLVLGGGAFAEPEGAAWPQQWSKRSKPKSQPANAASR